MARAKAMLALLLIASVGLAPLILSSPASAGDAGDPDMEDPAGDSVSGRTARDLVSGWIGNETETNIELNLQASSLEPFTPYQDWQNLPVVYYEFFFDVVTPQGLQSYSARATIPMHGPLAALAQYDLFAVTYGAGGTVMNETAIGTPVGRYLVNDAIISFAVDKISIGDPARGDILEGIWGRVQSASQRNTGDAITEDTMVSHLTPGRSFTFSGGITFYSIVISANSTSTNATPEDPARFTLTIHSDSEKVANVSLRNTSTMPANWTMSPDRPLYIIEPGGDVTATVTITPGGNTTNVTRRITVGATFKDDQNESRSSENALTFSVFVPPPAGGGGPGGGGPGGDPLGDNTFLLLGAAGGVAALGGSVLFVFGSFLPKRRRAAAQTSYTKISQLKLEWGSRSGALPGLRGAPGPRARTPSGPAPRPGMPRPGMPRPGAPRPGPPRGPPAAARPPRPVPRRR